MLAPPALATRTRAPEARPAGGGHRHTPTAGEVRIAHWAQSAHILLAAQRGGAATPTRAQPCHSSGCSFFFVQHSGPLE